MLITQHFRFSNSISYTQCLHKSNVRQWDASSCNVQRLFYVYNTISGSCSNLTVYNDSSC